MIDFRAQEVDLAAIVLGERLAMFFDELCSRTRPFSALEEKVAIVEARHDLSALQEVAGSHIGFRDEPVDSGNDGALYATLESGIGGHAIVTLGEDQKEQERGDANCDRPALGIAGGAKLLDLKRDELARRFDPAAPGLTLQLEDRAEQEADVFTESGGLRVR